MFIYDGCSPPLPPTPVDWTRVDLIQRGPGKCFILKILQGEEVAVSGVIVHTGHLQVRNPEPAPCVQAEDRDMRARGRKSSCLVASRPVKVSCILAMDCINPSGILRMHFDF